jgi:hypothetical protein
MVKNVQSTPNAAGNYSDWIELYNRGDTSADLAGMFLTDNLTDYKWQFQNGTSIAAHGFLIVWADNNIRLGALHTNFQLRAKGEELGLYASDGTMVDSVIYGKQIEDVSFGRTNDGASKWGYLINPSPGQSNTALTTVFTSYPWQVWAIIGVATAGACVAVVYEGKLWGHKKG